MERNSSQYRRCHIEEIKKRAKKINQWKDWKFFNCNEKIENFFDENKKSDMTAIEFNSKEKKYGYIKTSKRKISQLQLYVTIGLGRVL